MKKQHFLGLFLALSFMACEKKGNSENNQVANADSLAAVRTADSLAALNQTPQTAQTQPSADTPDVPLQKILVEQLKTNLSEKQIGEILVEGSDYTVFVPVEAAIAQASIKPSDWQNLLKSYTVKGIFTIPSFEHGQELVTLNGTKLKVEIIEGTLTVGGAEVVEQDLKAKNGIWHKINKVLLAKK